MANSLRERVCWANRQLQPRKLVFQSWGNISGIDREQGIVVIKPSGVPYDELTPERMVSVNLAGEVVDGNLRPSSDTPTHLELYRCFAGIGGICHTHSIYATMWAQACRMIPCLGTTHADYFYGPVPVTEVMTTAEIERDYELQTGKVIVRCFAELHPLEVPGVLVANHGPFTWGETPEKALEVAEVLEKVAQITWGTVQLNPSQKAISAQLLDRHYRRKHGEDAYYGQ